MACSRCKSDGHNARSCKSDSAIALPRVAKAPPPDDGLTRDQRRSARKRAVRKKTENKRRLRAQVAADGRNGSDDAYLIRPRTRGDCEVGGFNERRPCVWCACRYHLYLDVSPRNGSVTLNFPDVDPADLDQLPETCALDRASEGGITLEETGELLNVTRERIRQIEAMALDRMRLQGVDLQTFASERATPRRLPIAGGRADALPGRRAQMLKLRAEGLSHGEIAERLGLAPHSVRAALSVLRRSDGAEVIALRRSDTDDDGELALAAEEPA